MAEKERIIGPISAYAIAKAQGYTGTEAQFATYIANAATNAAKAEAAAEQCETLTRDLPDDFTQTQENFAPIYDDENGVYRAGEHAIYGGELKKALHDITTPEAFATKKWMDIDVGMALYAEEHGEILFHGPGTDTFTGTTYTFSRKGDEYTMDGTLKSSTLAMRAMLVRNISTTGSASYPSGRTTDLVLKDGHTYEARITYVSGSADQPSAGTVFNPAADPFVGCYAGFYKNGNGSKQGSSYGFLDWDKPSYARITYDAASMPNGITPAVMLARNFGTVGESVITYTNYTVKVTLHDITDQLAIAPVEHAAWAISGHAVGDIFWLDDGHLYRATSQILQAESIVPGSGGNCTATTIANELASLRAQLA